MLFFIKHINKKLFTIVTFFLILFPILLIQVYKTHTTLATGSSGDVGAFSTSKQAQLPENFDSLTTVTAAIGGSSYIYVLGGSAPNYQSTVYKATLDSSGNIGVFDTTSQAQLPHSISNHTTVTSTIGGTTYIYVLGGFDGFSTQSTVYKATIDSSGNIGTFDTTSQGQLPQPLFFHTAVTAAVGGTTYIYVLGGQDGSFVNQSTVYKATIDSNGDVGTFSTTNQSQLPQVLSNHTTVISNIGGTNYVYVLGGSNASSPYTYSTVYKATIDSSGNIGSFSTTSQGQLPQALYFHTTVTTTITGTNYIYVLGGQNDSFANQSTVYKATIDLTGNIGSFSTTTQGQLPETLLGHTTITSTINGTNYIYVLGGGKNTVSKATIDTSGDIGIFDTTDSQGHLAQAVQNLTTVTAVIGGTSYIYALGGHNDWDGSQSTVYKAAIDGSGNTGNTFSTTNQGQLPQTLYSHTTVTAIINGTNYIYVLGGLNDSVQEVSTVYKATIDSNGDIGTFDTTNQGQLPQDLNLHTTVTATIGGTNYIYVLGGENGVQVPQSTVYKATIDSNGDIGTFDTTNQGQLPEALNSHTTVIATIGGTTYIYVLGGCGDIDCPTSTVYKATIDDNGDIGTFDTTSQAQLPQAIYGHTTVTATIGGTNYIYVLETPTVYKATIDGNGDIGTFDTTDQGQLPLAIFSHASTTADVGGTTYIYVVGGTTGGEGRQVDTVYNAPLLELAPSPTDTPTPTPTSAPGSSATNTPTPGPGSPPICTDSKPGNPSNVIATAGPNSGQITLTWIAAPSPVTDYSITYSDNPTTQKYGVVSTSNTTSYVISGLKPNTKYYFWVNAVNGCEPGDQIGSATIGGGAVNDIATPSGNISNSSLLQNSGVNPLPVTGPLDLVKVGGIGAILMLVGAALLLAL